MPDTSWGPAGNQQEEKPKQQPQEEQPGFKKEEQAFLEKLQQRSEKAKPDQLVVEFLQQQNLQVKKPRIKDINFLAGNGRKIYALSFTNSNKDLVDFKLERLEPLTEFHGAFGFTPLVIVFWRHRKMPMYRIMGLNDGDVRVYRFKDLEHNLKLRLFTAHRSRGTPLQKFRWVK